jgi:hypothetical protein
MKAGRGDLKLKNVDLESWCRSGIFHKHHGLNFWAILVTTS